MWFIFSDFLFFHQNSFVLFYEKKIYKNVFQKVPLKTVSLCFILDLRLNVWISQHISEIVDLKICWYIREYTPKIHFVSFFCNFLRSKFNLNYLPLSSDQQNIEWKILTNDYTLHFANRVNELDNENLFHPIISLKICINLYVLGIKQTMLLKFLWNKSEKFRV